MKVLWIGQEYYGRLREGVFAGYFEPVAVGERGME